MDVDGVVNLKGKDEPWKLIWPDIIKVEASIYDVTISPMMVAAVNIPNFKSAHHLLADDIRDRPLIWIDDDLDHHMNPGIKYVREVMLAFNC